jgi:peptide/nickel transport system substrate-binding protein
MNRTLWSILLGLVLIGLLVACSQPAATTAPTATTSVATPTSSSVPTKSSPSATTPAVQQQQYGGILKLSYSSGPLSLGDSPTMTGRNYFFVLPALEFFLEQDANGDPLPKLATSWEIDPNGKFTIFNLRKGVTFQDGTPWNAQAAKINLEAIMAAPIVSLPGVTSIDVVDDYTIRLNTKNYSDVVISNLTVPISSPANLAKGMDAIKLSPVGTGAFKLADFQRDTLVKYQKWDGYWDKGKPYLDAIEINIIPDPMTASAAFQKGDTHWIDQPSVPAGLELKAKGYPYANIVGNELGLAPDSNNPKSIFTNLKVRQALNYAIDRQAISDKVGRGFLIPRPQWSNVGRPGYIPGTDYTYEPAKAKQLLAEAGYPNGFETSIIYPPAPYADENVVLAVQSYLAAIGINAKLDKVENAKWTEERYNSGWKDGLIYMQSGAFASMSRSFTMSLGASRHDYFSTARPSGTEDLLQQIGSTIDPKAKETLIQKMTKQLQDNATFVPLFFSVNTAFFSTKVHDTGRYDARQQLSAWSPQSAWLSK